MVRLFGRGKKANISDKKMGTIIYVRGNFKSLEEVLRSISPKEKTKLFEPIDSYITTQRIALQLAGAFGGYKGGPILNPKNENHQKVLMSLGILLLKTMGIDLEYVINLLNESKGHLLDIGNPVYSASLVAIGLQKLIKEYGKNGMKTISNMDISQYFENIIISLDQLKNYLEKGGTVIVVDKEILLGGLKEIYTLLMGIMSAIEEYKSFSSLNELVKYSRNLMIDDKKWSKIREDVKRLYGSIENMAKKLKVNIQWYQPAK